MIKWEYRRVHRSRLESDGDWNDLGSDGWEFCLIDDETWYFIFKRPIEVKEISPEKLRETLG